MLQGFRVHCKFVPFHFMFSCVNWAARIYFFLSLFPSLPKFNLIQLFLSHVLINSFIVVRNLSTIISRSNVTGTSPDKKWTKRIEFWHLICKASLLMFSPTLTKENSSERKVLAQWPSFDSVIDAVLGLSLVSSPLCSDTFFCRYTSFPLS